MKERPILFSGPMVRAILAGQKTQTRRVVKLRHDRRIVGDPEHDGTFEWWPVDRGDGVVVKQSRAVMLGECPYGVPGGRLWVRETWGEIVWSTIYGDRRPPRTEIVYRAGPHPFDRDVPHGWDAVNRWKPSIHMRRTDSRLTIEVVGVRVERLQKISRKDAKAEGFLPSGNGLESWGGQCYGNAQLAFEACWKDINGLESWNENPWVWVIEFAKLATPTPRGSRE